MGHASEMKTLKYLNTMVKEHVILKKTEYQNSNTFRTKVNNPFKIKHKKRPNTIPIFGLGKWLLGESRALKVGINAGG